MIEDHPPESVRSIMVVLQRALVAEPRIIASVAAMTNVLRSIHHPAPVHTHMDMVLGEHREPSHDRLPQFARHTERYWGDGQGSPERTESDSICPGALLTPEWASPLSCVSLLTAVGLGIRQS